jgi:hypothetical protein
MEMTGSSKMSADFQQTTWSYIPEDKTLHNHCENLKVIEIPLMVLAMVRLYTTEETKI